MTGTRAGQEFLNLSVTRMQEPTLTPGGFCKKKLFFGHFGGFQAGSRPN